MACFARSGSLFYESITVCYTVRSSFYIPPPQIHATELSMYCCIILIGFVMREGVCFRACEEGGMFMRVEVNKVKRCFYNDQPIIVVVIITRPVWAPLPPSPRSSPRPPYHGLGSGFLALCTHPCSVALHHLYSCCSTGSCGIAPAAGSTDMGVRVREGRRG